MNYNIDHNYLTEPIFDNLTGSKRYVTLMVLSIIRHFTKNGSEHQCTFYSTAFARDLGVKPNTVSTAIKYLLELNEIKCVRHYQRLGNLPAIYVSLKGIAPGDIAEKRYSPRDQKVYPLGLKGIAPGDKVNNSKRIIKEKNDVVLDHIICSQPEDHKDWEEALNDWK